MAASKRWLTNILLFPASIWIGSDEMLQEEDDGSETFIVLAESGEDTEGEDH